MIAFRVIHNASEKTLSLRSEILDDNQPLQLIKRFIQNLIFPELKEKFFDLAISDGTPSSVYIFDEPEIVRQLRVNGGENIVKLTVLCGEVQLPTVVNPPFQQQNFPTSPIQIPHQNMNANFYSRHSNEQFVFPSYPSQNYQPYNHGYQQAPPQGADYSYPSAFPHQGYPHAPYAHSPPHYAQAPQYYPEHFGGPAGDGNYGYGHHHSSPPQQAFYPAVSVATSPPRNQVDQFQGLPHTWRSSDSPHSASVSSGTSTPRSGSECEEAHPNRHYRAPERPVIMPPPTPVYVSDRREVHNKHYRSPAKRTTEEVKKASPEVQVK